MSDTTLVYHSDDTFETDELVSSSSENSINTIIQNKERDAWCLLIFAIIFEVGGTTCMRMVHSSEWYRFFAYVCYGASFSFFPRILQSINLSITYAIWSGIGTVLTSIISIFYFKETMSFKKVVCILGIILSTVSLNILD